MYLLSCKYQVVDGINSWHIGLYSEPIHKELIALRRELGIVAARPSGFTTSDILPFQEKVLDCITTYWLHDFSNKSWCILIATADWSKLVIQREQSASWQRIDRWIVGTTTWRDTWSYCIIWKCVSIIGAIGWSSQGDQRTTRETGIDTSLDVTRDWSLHFSGITSFYSLKIHVLICMSICY